MKRRVMIAGGAVIIVLFLSLSVTLASGSMTTKISGGAYFNPEGSYRASFSMDITQEGEAPPTGWFKYYYSRTRMNVVSTGITSIAGSKNAATVSGTCTVNAVGGYTFIATITDASPDIFGIVIKKPDGTVYYSAGPQSVAGGDLVIKINHAPVANAGPDQKVKVGDVVTLDGRNSYDPDGDLITYNWKFTATPPGSVAALSNPTSVMPTFIPDKPGDYIIVLTVSDAQAESSPDDVVVVAARPNVAPTAYAGPDQSVVTGSTVFLDGRGSSDPDGDPLTFRWQFIEQPSGSIAVLDNPASPTPSFVADKSGRYVIQLTVNDGQLDSSPDSVIVISAIPNAPPVAFAGNDQTVSRNKVINLDGTGSYDPENKPITYEWSIVSRPEGSASQLDDPTSPKPKILADKEGNFVFRLVVFDGQAYSAPDTVVVTVVNDPPVAEAGPNRQGFIGSPLSLDGSGSSDPNGDSLTYSWSIISKPQGSTAGLINPTSVNPTFTPDLPGTYTIQLIVNDGKVDSNPDTVIVTTINRDPVANPGGPYTGLVGNPVQFNGSGSSDPDGDPLTFSWNFGDGGTDSGVAPTHIFSSPGTYTVTLKVEDGRGGSNSAQTTAQITPIPFPPPSITGFTPGSGTVGTAVTINGTNFDVQGLRVSFNGVPAVVSKFTASSISTAVPMGASTGPITVATAGGSATSLLGFTVTSRYDFNLSANPSQATAAPGGQVTYTVSVTGSEGFTALVALSVQGLPNGFSGFFSPKTITSGQSSTLIITACDCTLSSPATLTITGSASIEGKTVTRSAAISLDLLAQGATTLIGRVLDTDAKPLKNVTIRVENSSTATDESGNFLLANPPIGNYVVLIDGSTASTATAKYPTIPITMNIVANKTNYLPYVPHLHAQKNYNFTPINPTKETKAEDPEVPGLQLRIPPGVNIIGWDGNANTMVSMRKVPIDALPVPPPPPDIQGKSVYMFYFGKVGGGVPTTPIPVTVPNDLGLKPGEKTELWYFNESPNINEAPNEWNMAGLGTVSADGKTITTDPGVGIPRFCCGAITVVPREPTGDDLPPKDDGCPGGDDPIDLASGVFIHSYTDLTLPGRIPITITRTYRTRDTFRGPYGVGTYFSYDWYVISSGNMATLVIPPGTRIPFSRQPDGNYINTDEPSYRGSRLIFNSDGTSNLRMKDGTGYSFDGNGLLIAQADRNGNEVRFLREVEYNVTKIIDSGGREVNINIQILGRDVITQITDPIGRKVVYNYDYMESTGRLKSVTDINGGVTQYSYDSKGRMKSIIDPLGRTILTNTYDANDRVCQQTDANGDIYTFYYITNDIATSPMSIQLLSEAKAGGPITTPPCSVTASGSPVAYTILVAPNNNITTYRFNSSGRIISTTDANGQTGTTNREQGTNMLLSHTDSLGKITSYTYDNNGNKTSKTDPDGRITYYEYEPIYNLLTKITDCIGNITRYEYDSRGNKIKTIDPMWHETTMAYDRYGQLISTTDPLGNTTRFEYDNYGNLTTTIDPLGNKSIQKYDKASRLISVTNPKGLTTQYDYNDLDKIIKTSDPIGNVTNFEYDQNGNLLKIIDAKGNSINYIYDERNRLKTMIDQLGNSENYVYDNNGNLIRFADRKENPTNITYDASNRKSRIDYVDGSYIKYTYDVLGRIIRIDDSVSGNIEYEYDNDGSCAGCGSGGSQTKVKREITPLGAMEYEYDNLGRRTSMRVNGQAPVEYRYNNGSLLTDIIHPTLGTVNIGYDDSKRRKSLMLPNGINATYYYDNGSRLIGINFMKGTALVVNIIYTIDETGNRTSFNRADQQAELPEAVNATFNKANQLLSFNDKNITHDKNGNITSITSPCGETNYTWDSRNRLIGVSGFTADCKPLTASFKYDALNRRIEKSINGKTIEYLYDGQDIIQEIENGVVITKYLRGLNIDEILGREGNEGKRYYLMDGLGSIIALTDTNGVIKTSYAYDPYGRTSISGDPSDNPFQYTGRENDGTGLYYYRARYYSSELQRFVSNDKIISINLYAYVHNNPIIYRDPYGLFDFGQFVGTHFDYGNWCGQSRSGGESGVADGDIGPLTVGYVDCLDMCCKAHDINYYNNKLTLANRNSSECNKKKASKFDASLGWCALGCILTGNLPNIFYANNPETAATVLLFYEVIFLRF